MTSIYGPVTDWATDFDHAEPEYNANAHEIWTELRGTCPVAHTDRYEGAWLPVTHEHVSQIAYDTEHFTSRSVIVTTYRPFAEAPIGNAPPISSDLPFHHDARRLLLPAFAPKAIALGAALLLLGSFMDTTLTDFTRVLFDRLVLVGGS